MNKTILLLLILAIPSLLMTQTFGLDLYSNTNFENTRPGIETTLGYGAGLVGIIHIDESADMRVRIGGHVYQNLSDVNSDLLLNNTFNLHISYGIYYFFGQEETRPLAAGFYVFNERSIERIVEDYEYPDQDAGLGVDFGCRFGRVYPNFQIHTSIYDINRITFSIGLNVALIK